MDYSLPAEIWAQLLWPLLRILFFVALGLMVASLIESLKWTNHLAALARPLVRLGRLSAVSGASFTMAFVSGVSANTILAEALDQGRLEKKEMILANLFNSLPRYFLHLPTVFFLTVPLIKGAAFLYVGITFLAALLQTMAVVVVSRLMLHRNEAAIMPEAPETAKPTIREALKKGVKRLKSRMKKITFFLVPVYILFFVFGRIGVFDRLEEIFASAWFLSWLNPQSLGIVILHVTAEFSAGLAAASVLLADNSLGAREVVLALLAGNILAAPIRAVRHQLPYYMGIFPPKLAFELIALSQIARAACVIAVGLCYYYFTLSLQG
ncbi:MAG: hypothetical protein V2I36_03000 [Desulfopila sp.]|jgi:hypothetical protein|nr:hypothetical protein [Desulfopila sp.]